MKNLLSFWSLVFFIFLIFNSLNMAAEGTLFVGLEGSTPPTYHSYMTGFPNITWINNYSFDVSGAAATPDGTIYIIEGAFTTHLYEATLLSSPQQICTISEDMSALAYGNNTLYGYSNYATPKGIYSIDTTTGAATLVLDVYTGTGFRFFALDYNPLDSLFYGYTEYGASGLYSINIDTGDMIQLTGTIPASNGQGRGMAVGDNTVYLTATRGDDGIPFFAYDISQGVGGSWVEFTNPYPNYHSTGGAAWIPNQVQTIQISGHVVGSDEPGVGLANCDVILSGDNTYQTQTDLNGDFLITEVVGNADYSLEISHAGFETYNTILQAGIVDIDLGTIELDELAYPATEVLAVVNVENTEVLLTWNSPTPDERDLESYDVYRFLEINSVIPFLWELISEGSTDTSFVDTDWILLEPDIYQYAVVAVYSNGIVAEAAFSNVVEKLQVFNPPQNLYVDHTYSFTNNIYHLYWEVPEPCNATLINYNIYVNYEVYVTVSDSLLDYVIIDAPIMPGSGESIFYVTALYENPNGESEPSNIVICFPMISSEQNIVSSANLLIGNYPNPFNPETTISFSLNTENTSLHNATAWQAEDTELIIYNLKGQKIKTLYPFPNGSLGTREVVWNGTDENNQPVSSGIYFYQLKIGNQYSETKRMLLLK
ncbi:MAG: hypothetical protein HQ534_07075 [Armatimonadetes bacterium]|nr:hypothetical protein [Armatimonadota bacterium]